MNASINLAMDEIPGVDAKCIRMQKNLLTYWVPTINSIEDDGLKFYLSWQNFGII